MNNKKALIAIITVFSFTLIFYLSHFFLSKDFSKAACAKLKAADREIFLELARTRQEQTLGLMFRRSLAADRGMFFVFNSSDKRTFWMKNTMLPLDILFIDSSLRVKRIFSGVPVPFDNENEETIPRVSAEAKYVLEIASGTAASLGIKEGDGLNLKAVDRESCPEFNISRR
ncbi:MAG: hypothetical protein Fur0012_09110 [Elusimicrobiota bacterium]